MAGRSLFTFLILAMVAMLSFVAAKIEDGIYTISLFEKETLTAKHQLGARVTLNDQLLPPGSQQWDVKQHLIRGFTIRHAGPSPVSLYLAPANPKKLSDHEVVVLSSTPFYWRLEEIHNRIIFIARVDLRDTSSALGITRHEYLPYAAEVQSLRPGDRLQEWEFRRWRSANLDVQSRTGSWRIEEDSLCL
ncbi:hypothetical protein B0O80DRAFT_166015 [Mortierella sp. GBAus27b]|nr:hypothetical protein BGX31_011162 [Mortierella sp. GBA43]KAI8349245.1 hypothetical protein B0O80DRAFT_166015 [Mortierella sp. GBAus27b]